MLGVGVAGCQIYGAVCDCGFRDGMGGTEWVGLANTRDQF